MKMLLVIGLLAFIVLIVALAVRRGSGGGYQRRFAPTPAGRKRPDAGADAVTAWAPAIFVADSSSSLGAPGPDCSSGAHSGGDCGGASAGADGGGGS